MLGRKNKMKSGDCRFSLFYGKLSIHPLFLLFGIWYSFTGELLYFLSVALCAILHELAHAAAAAKIGYAMEYVRLMPYGATVKVDMDGVSARDELRIALAGPIFNLALAAFFLALWWCYPVLYPYTETAFYSTLSLGLCNLLPALPLDGGRALYCLLFSAFNAYLPPAKSKKRALLICKIITIFTCFLGAFAFIFSCIKHTPMLSLGAFTLFLIAGLFSKKNSAYIKLDFSSRKSLNRGIPIKHVAIGEECTVKKALGFLSAGQYLVLDVYTKKEKYLGSVTQNELSDFFQKTRLSATLKEYFHKF